MISELEEALSELRIREDAWVHEREQLMMFHRQQKQCIDELIAEKEEIVRRHTIETGELRRKNAYLADQVQKMDSIAMSAGPSSTGYSADFSNFDHLTMESSPWDNFSMVTDFNIETEQKQDNSLVVLPKKEKPAGKDNETTTASGLLLMLLLCGAWVASNNTSTASASIPRMPEDVRVASGAVLETIYRDAGLAPQTLQSNQSQRSDVTPSSAATQSPKTTLTSNEFASVSRSPLASFHQQLISPNEQQQGDQIFSLSAEQYNGIVGDDDVTGPKPTPLNHRRNLREALSALRSSKQGSAAEVYTRSLMWDEVPANVVRDFARMMADARLASRDPLS